MTLNDAWLNDHAKRTCAVCFWRETEPHEACWHPSAIARTCWMKRWASRCPHWLVVRTEPLEVVAQGAD